MGGGLMQSHVMAGLKTCWRDEEGMVREMRKKREERM